MKFEQYKPLSETIEEQDVITMNDFENYQLHLNSVDDNIQINESLSSFTSEQKHTIMKIFENRDSMLDNLSK